MSAMTRISKLSLAAGLMALAHAAQALPLNYWADNGFVQIGDDEGVGRGGYVNPGWGGQDFDAEYLFYKLEGQQLHVGLQTGFDVSDGHLRYQHRDYYAGDLALSVDGDTSAYEFAIDFGWLTRDYDGDLVDAGTGTGIDAAGVYSVDAWNNDIYFPQSSPFAMDEGSWLSGLSETQVGFANGSYYRTAAFDFATLGLGDDFFLDMHWTMNCGNDHVHGHASVEVPEPATPLLLAMGLAGLALSRRRSRC